MSNGRICPVVRSPMCGGTGLSLTEETPRPTQVALTDEFCSAIDDARARVAAVLEPACPTATFLAALREEVVRAIEEPEAVPYPELSDADEYWDATVKPQARSVRASVEAIVDWLEERVVVTMEVAEADLKSMVDRAAADAGADPAAARAALAAEIDARCLELHHQMAKVLTVLPPKDALFQARQSAADAVRARATVDVDGLKASYLREAGGGEDHQRFAEQQWSETFADRMSHREAMLAGVAPWRHQELALVGYERVISEAEGLVEQATVRLQAPLQSILALLLERFDESLVRAN